MLYGLMTNLVHVSNALVVDRSLPPPIAWSEIGYKILINYYYSQLLEHACALKK